MERDISKLNSILDELKKEKNLEENLSIIIREIEKEIDFKSLGIFLYVPVEKNYRLKISRKISHTFAKNTIFNKDDELIKSLANLEIHDFYDDTEVKFEKNYTHLVVIPLHNNKQLLGFIFMDKNEGEFSEADITKISIFSSIISLGVNLNDLRDELSKIQIFDKITSLYTYKSFCDRCEYIFSLTKRHKKPLVMAVFKVNKFSDILRTFGKQKVNKTAEEVGKILKSQIRNSDLAGKISKDTIAIFMPETTPAKAKIVLKRLDTSIMDMEVMKDSKLGWGISILNDKVIDVHQLLLFAEAAAFEAIRNYDTNIIVYTEE